MKRNILKLFAIVAAFFVGVSINNSCGESKMETETHGTGNGSSGSDDEILIDGLYFNRSGAVSSKPIKITANKISGNHVVPEYTYTYVYDNKGRIKQITMYVSDISGISGYKTVSTYEYSGKKVIATMALIHDNDNYSDSNYTTQSVTEYY